MKKNEDSILAKRNPFVSLLAFCLTCLVELKRGFRYSVSLRHQPHGSPKKQGTRELPREFPFYFFLIF